MPLKMYKTSVYTDAHAHQIRGHETLTVLNVFAGDEFPVDTPELVYFSQGIHPWYLDNWQYKLEKLYAAARSQKIVAIGECGLDKNVSASMDIQLVVFEHHIRLSESLHKPLIIHCVKAFDELFRMRKEIKPSMPWIVHGFNKSRAMGSQCLDHGFLLSFGKALFGNTGTLDLIKSVPVEKFFLETENIETDIASIYQKCAEIRNTSTDNLKVDIFKNFCKVFGIIDGDNQPQP